MQGDESEFLDHEQLLDAFGDHLPEINRQLLPPIDSNPKSDGVGTFPSRSPKSVFSFDGVQPNFEPYAAWFHEIDVARMLDPLDVLAHNLDPFEQQMIPKQFKKSY